MRRGGDAAVAALGADRAVQAAGAADQAEEDEARWTAVVDSARHLRKARGKAKKKAKEQREPPRRSVRIAGLEPDHHVPMADKAMQFRELKSSLKWCSAKLQAHISDSKVMQKLRSPLGMKTVSDLRKAAFEKNRVGAFLC